MEKTVVTIYPREIKKHLPKDILLEANQKIGASFTESGEINSGLTLTEKKKWLPSLVEVGDNDPTFFAKVKEFFASLTLKVPKEGIKLNITLDEEGNPVNVMDYIRYKFALANPKVAPKEEAKITSEFFIENPKEKLKEKKAAQNLGKNAYREFIKATSSKETIAQLIINCGLYNPDMDSEEYELVLDEYVKKNPQAFLDVVKDPNLETKAFINKCISAEVLRKVGTSIINGDQTIGNTDDDAVAYLKDKANSEVLVTLKARLREFESKR